jgi:hypothetical protein
MKPLEEQDMSYSKFTIATGTNASGEIVQRRHNGHAEPYRLAQKLRAAKSATGSITVSHCTADISGRGRGGIDREFTCPETLA